MPAKALEKAMTRAIALRTGQALPVNAFEKAMSKDCLEKGEAMPVKALEKAMTRAIALNRGRRCR